MAPPDLDTHLRSLIGQTIYTVGRPMPNVITEVQDDAVVVTARQSGQRVEIAVIQDAVDRVWAGEEVEINTDSVGFRSAFVGAVLGTLGVEVLTDPLRVRLPAPPAGRNPPWEYDELVLALDLYLRRGQPPTRDPEVVALSDLLNRLPIHADRPDRERFRNPNGVHMKLANFKGPDPSYTGRGLAAGGRGVYEVWDRFADDPDALAEAVSRITASADPGAIPPKPEDDEEVAVEGRILFREHRVRERDRAVVAKKKASVIRREGRLACEVCGVDFAERYGELGEGFIECHHTLPLAAGDIRSTSLTDLALVCPNCHRMLHRSRPMMSIEQLSRVVRDAARASA